MPRHFYACSHPYGRAVHADTGEPIRTVYAFESARERDAWVVARPTDYVSTAGYREPLRARDLTARERSPESAHYLTLIDRTGRPL